jgi:hypothetical protein
MTNACSTPLVLTQRKNGGLATEATRCVRHGFSSALFTPKALITLAR